MNTNTPSAPSTLTLAKTGTVHGRPALVAYEGKQTILLVLPAEEGSDWSEIDRSPHSGIRGLGQMMKKLDKDSARNPSDQPAWIKGAQVEPAGSVLASAVASAAPGIVAMLRADEVPAVESVPAAVEPVGEQAPVVEVAASPLAGFLAADVIAEVATTTDLAFLRAAREEAARAGATPDALRVISMRAGEVVLGFDPAALKRKVAAPKAEKVEKAPRAPRPEGATRGDWKAYAATVAERMEGVESLTIQVQAETEPLGFGKSAWTPGYGSTWHPTGPAGKALATHGLAAKFKDGTVVITRK